MAERGLLVPGLVAVLGILLLLVMAPPLVNIWTGMQRARLTSQIEAFEAARANVENDLQTMLAAARGYLITQQPSFLDTYRSAEARLPADVAALKELAPDVRDDLAADVAEVEAQVNEWHTTVGEQLAFIQEDDLAAAVADVSSGRGQEFFDVAVQQLDRLELEGREASAAIATNVARLQLVASGLAVGLGLLATLPGIYMIRLFRHSAELARQLGTQRDRAEQATAAARDQLEETRRRNKQLTTLSLLASASSAPLAVQTRAEGLLAVLAPSLGADFAAIWLLPTTGGPMQLVAAHTSREGLQIPEAQPLEQSETIAQLLSENRPMVVTHGRLDEKILPPSDAGALSRVNSYALLPLGGREGPIGVLLLVAEADGAFHEGDDGFYTTIATQAGLALNNAQLFEELSADRQRLQAVFDQSPEGVIFAEADNSTIVLANRAAMALLGESDLVGRSLNEPTLISRFLRPNGEPYNVAELPLQRAMDGAPEVRAEIVVEQSDGARLPALMTSVPLRDDAGAVRGVVAVLQNLSHLREVERLKSDFVAMVSHELRTPLTAIQGCTQTLLRSPDGGAQRTREFLTIINEQSGRLQELIDNLLNLSQVEAGALRLRREPLQIERLIRSVVRQAGEHLSDLRIQADIRQALPTINADPRRVEQVILNLLDNARKASPPGGIITVSALIRDGEVHIGVRDQGAGIPAVERERVFERFYQSTRAAGTGGTGLGLTICRALVEAHGGRIWVADNAEGGAQLWFTLPTQSIDGEGKAPSGSLATAIQQAHDTAHLLVVDDEASLRVVLESSLTNAGYTVGTAAEGVGALEYIATERPDLVLLDLMLPGDDGFSVLQQLRDFTSVPVMILTASSDEQHIVRGLQLGADDYLVKPFGMDELMARIEALLRRSGAVRDSREPTVFEAGDLSIDMARRVVQRNGTPIELTPIEYRILTYLARHVNQVLTHEQILRHVWGAEYGGESQYLWVHIGRLRQKIEVDPKKPRHILTERGTGYRFEA